MFLLSPAERGEQEDVANRITFPCGARHAACQPA